MVRLVEARSLEDETDGVEHSVDVIAAGGAGLDRVIGDFLPGVKARAAGLAQILVRGHMRVYSLPEPQNHCQSGGAGGAIRLPLGAHAASNRSFPNYSTAS